MDEDSRTIFCGNLSSRCDENILYELFLQAGPLEKVYIPKDRDGSQKCFGFITYKHAISVPYAINLFDGTMLYNRTLTLKPRQAPESLQPAQQLSPMPMPMPLPMPMPMPMPLNFPNIHPMVMNQTFPPLNMNMMPMFSPPGLTTYPSQINSSPFMKEDRYNIRNHPYSRECERDRERDRGRDRDRDRDRDRERERERDRDRDRDRDRERNRPRDRHSDYDYNHRREHKNLSRGSNNYSRSSRHYR